ncbi:MAG: hypothetical protein R2828_21505 [Saprospiraceae bacterium]
MKKIIFLVIWFLVISGCKTSFERVQQLSTVDTQNMNLTISIRGASVLKSEVNINLVEVIDSNTISLQRDTFYDIFCKNLLFRVRKSYIDESDQSSIRYDDRRVGNVVKKELPKESFSFIRKYFILDTGLEDLYLLPIIKDSK